MKFKSFSQFLAEGARWNSDKSGVIVSLDNRENDLFLTNTKSTITKMGGFGKYIFDVRYGLGSSIKEEDLLSDGDLERDYSNLMQKLKQGYFNMMTQSEPDHKMSIKDIHKGVHADLSEYDKKLFFQFMKETGKIDPKLKYVVMAESNDVMTKLMADVISKYTGAEIIKLSKNRYNDSKILRFYKDLPALDTNISREKLTNFQVKILDDYANHVATNMKGREAVEDGMEDAVEILKAMGMEISGAPFLKNVFRRMTNSEEPLVIKGNRLFNNVRNYLNTKYNFDENFINKVHECLKVGSTSKMLIIDDNIQHGSDFREIMNMCGYVTDVLQVTEKTSLKALAKTQIVKRALTASSSKAAREKLEKELFNAEVAERADVNNISGYVLYKRPVITSSDLEDDRTARG
jgi:hypothetical protein